VSPGEARSGEDTLLRLLQAAERHQAVILDEVPALQRDDGR